MSGEGFVLCALMLGADYGSTAGGAHRGDRHLELEAGEGEMSGHTPGPWVLQNDRRACMVVAQGGGLAVIVSEVGRKPTKIDEANARLIAAAPELLEAAKGLLEVLTLGSLEAAAKYGPNYDRDEADKFAADLAVAAIAKAEGK